MIWSRSRNAWPNVASARTNFYTISAEHGVYSVTVLGQWRTAANDIAAERKTLKTILKSLGAVILGGGLFIGGCADKQRTSFQSLKDPELAAHLKSFVAEKEAQARAATNKMPSQVQA